MVIQMKKVGTLLSSFLPVIVSLGIQIAVSLILGFWFAVFKTAVDASQGATVEQILAELPLLYTSPLFNDLLLAITYISCGIVFLQWYRKQREKRTPAGSHEVFCIRNLIIYLITGFSTQVAVSMCLVLLLPLFPQTQARYMQLLESLIGGNVFVTVLATVILAPIVEEIIFRELMTKKLCKLFPFWFVNIIQAITFGIYHLNIVQAVYAFVLGLLLGYVAYRLKSVWASVILHGAINASALVVDILLPEALMESITGMIIFAVLCGSITILLSLLYHIPRSGVAIDYQPVLADADISAAAFVSVSAAEAETSDADTLDADTEL